MPPVGITRRAVVLFAPADDSIAAVVSRVVEPQGFCVRTVSRLDTVTVAGQIIVMAGDVASVTAAVTAGAAAVVAVAGAGVDVAALIAAGTRAVVPADEVDRELPAGLEAARAGALYIAPAYTGRLRSALDARAADALTPRELETLRWVVLGQTHREVAETMGITEATVNTYLKRLRSKLNVTNKAQLTRVAIRSGLV